MLLKKKLNQKLRQNIFDFFIIEVYEEPGENGNIYIY